MKEVDHNPTHLGDGESEFISLTQNALQVFMAQAQQENMCADCCLAMMAAMCMAQILLRESHKSEPLNERAGELADIFADEAERLALLLSVAGTGWSPVKPRTH
jgi:hypothetical protein